jgi:hypothetical protein
LHSSIVSFSVKEFQPAVRLNFSASSEDEEDGLQDLLLRLLVRQIRVCEDDSKALSLESTIVVLKLADLDSQPLLLCLCHVYRCLSFIPPAL